MVKRLARTRAPSNVKGKNDLSTFFLSFLFFLIAPLFLCSLFFVVSLFFVFYLSCFLSSSSSSSSSSSAFSNILLSKLFSRCDALAEMLGATSGGTRAELAGPCRPVLHGLPEAAGPLCTGSIGRLPQAHGREASLAFCWQSMRPVSVRSWAPIGRFLSFLLCFSVRFVSFLCLLSCLIKPCPRFYLFRSSFFPILFCACFFWVFCLFAHGYVYFFGFCFLACLRLVSLLRPRRVSGVESVDMFRRGRARSQCSLRSSNAWSHHAMLGACRSRT